MTSPFTWQPVAWPNSAVSLSKYGTGNGLVLSSNKPLHEPMLTLYRDMPTWLLIVLPLRWRQNERNGVSNHRCLDCLLNRLFRPRSKKASKFRVTGPCEGNPPVTTEFPSQRASKAEKVSIWWRQHATSGSSNLISIIWTSDEPVYRRIYSSLRDDEFVETDIDFSESILISMIQWNKKKFTKYTMIFKNIAMSAHARLQW